MPRFSTLQLNRLFLDALGDSAKYVDDPAGKPLLVDVDLGGTTAKISVYLFNCTNPPGGRKSDEYKSQLIFPGQQRGERGSFLKGDGRIVLLGAVATLAQTDDTGVFVFWDAMYHDNCSYSTNIQVKSEVLIGALAKNVNIGLRASGEKIVACRPDHLVEGIKERIFTV